MNTECNDSQTHEEMNHLREQLEEVVRAQELPATALKILQTPEREVRTRLTVDLDDRVGVFPAYRVLWNSARGPGKGGIRFHPGETPGEIHKLAALMSLKTAVAGLPLGGAKGGVCCDVKNMSAGEKESVCRQYIRKFYPVLGPKQDVPAPDVYVTPRMISWMLDEYESIAGRRVPGVITGKPTELGGSKLRNVATALGGVFVIKKAAERLGMDLEKKTVAIQGFGNAGANFHRLARKLLGVEVVAASDSAGAVHRPGGLKYDRLADIKEKEGTVTAHPDATGLTNGELLELDVDVLVPAALGNVITAENAAKIKCDLLLELANGPTTRAADEVLSERDVTVLPDLLANSGGVTVSYFEQVQNSTGYYWSEDKVRERLERKVGTALETVMDLKEKNDVNTRRAAYLLAVQRICRAMELRGEL